MNTTYFIDDLRSDLAFAKKSVSSLRDALDRFDNHESTLSSFRRLRRCGELIAELHAYFPELYLPFKPTEDEITALRIIADDSVELSKGEYQWHEWPQIPQPDMSYVEDLERMLSDALSRMQGGEIVQGEKLQESISGLAADWIAFEEDDDGDEGEGILTVRSIPHFLSQRVARGESSEYPGEELIISNVLSRVANHPDSCLFEAYFHKHGAVPREKLQRHENVIELFPALVRKFENSSYTKRHWIYRAYDEEGTLLYIGQTSSPLKRLRQHAGLNSQAEHLFREGPWRRNVSEWFPKLDRIEWQPFSNTVEARAAEATFIEAEAPPYNKVFNKNKTTHLLGGSQTMIEPPSLNDPRNVEWETFRPSRVRLPVYGFARDI